jgi:hypothetical protein
MAFSLDPQLCIRPWLRNEIEPRARILQDGPDGYTGVNTWRTNMSTLWARSGHPLLTEVREWGFTMPDTSERAIASYVVPIPLYLNAQATSGRRYFEVLVRTPHHGSLTYRARDINYLLLATGTNVTVLGVQYIRLLIPVNMTGDLAFILTAQWSGSGHAVVNISEVRGEILKLTSIGTGNVANRIGYIEHLDTDQTVDQAPLTTYMVRCLTAANTNFFRYNVRPVVTRGLGQPMVSPDLGGTVKNNAWNIKLKLDANPYWEYLYYPRQGAETLKIHMNVYGELGSERLVVHFAGHEGAPFTVTATGNTHMPLSWFPYSLNTPLFLRVPPGPGPHRLRVSLAPSAGTSSGWVLISALCVHEVIDDSEVIP